MAPIKLGRRDVLKSSALLALGLNLSEGRVANANTSEKAKTHTPVEAQLKRLNELLKERWQDRSPGDVRVAILGAGMAGLSVAYELQKFGFNVTVYEASQRAGGRVWTKRFDPSEPDGHHHEFGAMRVPASHDYTRHYIKEMDLKLRPFVTSHREPNAFYYFRNGFEKDNSPLISKIGQAGRAVNDPSSPNGPRKTFYQRLNYALSAQHHYVAQHDYAPSLFGLLMVELIGSLTEEDVESLFGFRAPTPTIAKLDSITLGQFLIQGLADAPFGSSREALEIIGSTTGLSVWWDKALTMFLRDELTGTGEGLEEIIGGMDSLPTKLASKLAEGTLQYAHQVTAVKRVGPLNTPDEKVVVTFNKLRYPDEPLESEAKPPLPDPNDSESLEFEFVICTLPFPVLRTLDVSPLSPTKRASIRNLNYASSSKVLFYCKRRFWEGEKYQIVGGASHSDKITRATYYPSDQLALHMQEMQIPSEPNRSGSRSRFSTTPLSDSARQLVQGQQQTTASAARNSGNPFENNKGVLVASYNWGRDARTMGALTKPQRAEACKNVIKNFHPEITEDGLILDFDSIFWDQHPWSRAAFCFMNPGDLKNYYSDAIRPEGRIHFAGEHCSLDQAWIQGALISALRAAEEVLSS